MLKNREKDIAFMKIALECAYKAYKLDEVPVGCVIVDEKDSILAKSFNKREHFADPTGHAEILALREAALKRGNWRLNDCVLYVTLEPCIMCAGAIVLARIKRVVFGAFDPKFGGCGSIYDILRDERLNHRVEVKAGVLQEECSKILSDFFAKKRRGGRAD